MTEYWRVSDRLPTAVELSMTQAAKVNFRLGRVKFLLAGTEKYSPWARENAYARFGSPNRSGINRGPDDVVASNDESLAANAAALFAVNPAALG